MADSTKVIRLMIGFDDKDPEHVKLVPRNPTTWNQMVIGNYPVRIQKGTQQVSYTYECSEQEE